MRNRSSSQRPPPNPHPLVCCCHFQPLPHRAADKIIEPHAGSRLAWLTQTPRHPMEKCLSASALSPGPAGTWGTSDPPQLFAFFLPGFLYLQAPLNWLLSTSSNLSPAKNHPVLHRVSPPHTFPFLLPCLCLSLSLLFCPPPRFSSHKKIIINEHSLPRPPYTHHIHCPVHILARKATGLRAVSAATGQCTDSTETHPGEEQAGTHWALGRWAWERSKTRLLSPKCPALNTPGCRLRRGQTGPWLGDSRYPAAEMGDTPTPVH